MSVVTSWAADEGKEESRNDTGAQCVFMCMCPWLVFGLVVVAMNRIREEDTERTWNGMWRFVGLKWEFHQHSLIEHKYSP